MTVSELPVALACPCCQGATHTTSHSIVAPFITALARLPTGSESDLRLCESCDLAYFSARYRDQDLALLYGGYRGDTYVRERRRWEPWYSKGVNEANTGESPAVLERRAFMTRVLQDAGLREPLACAVDFGGDQGQFFPDMRIDRRIVCDPSDSPLDAGVERIPDLVAVQDVKPQLVIAAHVLEHLADPVAPLEAMRRCLDPAGLLYVEVPLDRFATHSWHASEGYRRYLGRLSRHRWAFIFVDLVTGLSRQYGRRVPRLGIVKQSEHINYFSPRSLKDLLARTGYRVVAENVDPKASVGGLRIGRYGVAARPDSH
jgi:hypothetical protein